MQKCSVLTATEANLSECRGLAKAKDVFTWEHVNYDIALRDGTRRRLLNDVAGYVKPGTLTALMGESGLGRPLYSTYLLEELRSVLSVVQYR